MWDNRSRLSRHRLESLCHQAFPDLWVGQIPRRNCLGKSPLNPPRGIYLPPDSGRFLERSLKNISFLTANPENFLRFAGQDLYLLMREKSLAAILASIFCRFLCSSKAAPLSPIPT